LKTLLAATLATLTMPFDLPAQDPPAGVSVELRTFIAHGDPDSRGLSCVVVNQSPRAVTAWKNYDAGHNVLLGEAHFPIALIPEKKPEAQHVTIESGMSKTIFTLGIDAIFFLRPEMPPRDWRWTWYGSPPRGMPPMSPFHGHRGLGWEVRRGESASVLASVEVDGRRVNSAPLEIRAKKLRTETLKTHARVDSADWQRDRDPNYEIRLRVLKDIEGSLAKEERTLRLPWGDAEHLLAAAGARLVDERNRYAFAGPSMNFTFARVLSDEGRPLRTLLMSYEKAADITGAPFFADAEGKPLIHPEEITSYDWKTHTVRFRRGVFERLRKQHAGELVGGVVFTLRLGEVVVYPGVFTIGASSNSKKLPVILLDGKDTAIIQLGYPTEEHFNGEDPRADPRLRKALLQAGLLRK
jgi:hypothetical protein